MRRHRKVWLWWGAWWAIQFYRAPCLSFGLHLDFAMPYADVHFLWLTISVGRNPVVTNERERNRGSCRGFLFRDDPLL